MAIDGETLQHQEPLATVMTPPNSCLQIVHISRILYVSGLEFQWPMNAWRSEHGTSMVLAISKRSLSSVGDSMDVKLYTHFSYILQHFKHLQTTLTNIWVCLKNGEYHGIPTK